MRARERRLAERHTLRYRLADEHSFDGDFETLVRLHELRWGGTTAVFAGRGHAFQRDAARALLATGRLRLWVLELDGEPAAAWQGFRMDGAESYYQSGRDPRFDSESAGFVLLCHTIREALADGMGEYRFLLGGEAYKDRFANADPGVVSLVVATSRSAAPLSAPRPCGGVFAPVAAARALTRVRDGSSHHVRLVDRQEVVLGRSLGRAHLVAQAADGVRSQCPEHREVGRGAGGHRDQQGRQGRD